MKFYTIIALMATASAIKLSLHADPKPEATDAAPLPKKAGKEKAKEEEEPALPNFGRA